MPEHAIVSRNEWLEARKALLDREKQLTRMRDEVTALRAALPWVRVEQPYAFATPAGTKSLAELFERSSQLVVYHFMFDPSWDEGCKSCSFWADNFERNVIHVQHRDVTLIAVSRAPLDKLAAYKSRMGWTFTWVSSSGTDFNRDFGVSWTADEIARGEASYNYAPTTWEGESPGISVFTKDAGGAVFHTYSCYARGLDMMNAAYHYLDLVPKGRDERALEYPMAWLRRRDEYEGPLVTLTRRPR